jgi:hypothetical protein
MEYESKFERVKTNSKRGRGENLPQEKRDQIQWMTQEGYTQREIKEETGVSDSTVVAVRQDMGDKDIDIGNYKKQTADIFKRIVMRGAKRLDDEIDKIPIGAMPVSLAILIDKIAILQDQPTVIIENRLRVTHDDINKYLQGEVIDLPVSEKPESENTIPKLETK